MKSKLRDRDGPLYLQIADRLREDIGAMDSGARIPSEPQLAKDWGVSRFTVAKAVEQLVDEGLITRRQGSGSFVAEAPLRRAPGYLLSFTEAVEAAGHRASHKLIAFKPTEWREGLPYETGTTLMLLDRLRLVDGIAVARHKSVLSAELLEEIGLTEEVARAPTFSLYRYFGEHGLSVQTATERLHACAAEPDDRTLLGLTGDGVVVAVTRHSFAADGTPLDAVAAIYDARRYSYEARLVRRHQGNHQQETNHEDILDSGRGHIGPRLGPWDGRGDGR
ncbi:GntR family transcriptional regulator [Mesorhizobium sp. L-8-3]|uniref:GntR family transcriptional regulator n=1 Tax=Mesorhizobium sp. L-8-3 TaxID=2744522 RepID=UPI001926620E|nr:GntR family transcriptional regulator [Mesorhizobium sp. L-8-3]BCH21467.1 GntR family transcriptional regulator [Mesorhizobium sp. L-8-3]